MAHRQVSARDQIGSHRAAPRPGALNVVVVTVDCMRRDRLSAYGYDRATTPFLDGLLERSLHCTSAHSVSSWTCPAVVSLNTGLYPHRHGGGIVPGEPKNLSKQNLPTKLRTEVPTLPEILGAQGYSSAAMLAVWNAHLPMPGRYPVLEMTEKPARKMVRRALRWIGEQDRPFLLWLHLGDTHEPLDVPRSLRGVFGRPPRVRKALRWDYTKGSDDVGSPGFERYRTARVLLYDAAVRAVDESLRDLWSGLAQAGVRDRTVLAVTADHGEEFWEHREEEMAAFTDPRGLYGTGHGHNLFQVHLLVPLIFTGPGIQPGALDANVSLVDVMPTVLDALDVESPPADGRSLVGSGGSGLAGRPVLAESLAYGFEKKAVILGDHKLLAGAREGYERLFALGSDRREVRVVEDRDVTAGLRQHLPGEGVMGEQVEHTEEIEDHLRTLGYIE